MVVDNSENILWLILWYMQAVSNHEIAEFISEMSSSCSLQYVQTSAKIPNESTLTLLKRVGMCCTKLYYPTMLHSKVMYSVRNVSNFVLDFSICENSLHIYFCF